MNGEGEAGKPPEGRLLRDVLVAGSLFIVSIYAPFVIATQMPVAGLKSAEAFRVSVVLVLLSTAIGTAVSGRLTNMPLVLAPAVGLTVFFAAGRSLLGADQLYMAAMVAGLVVLFANLNWFEKGTRSLRYYILRDMPPPIRAGVSGGVGALLAESAIRLVDAHHAVIGDVGLLIVFVTAGLIFGADIWAERLRERASDRTDVGPTYYILKLAYILMPLLMIVVLLLMRPDLAGPTASVARESVAQLGDRFGWSARPNARDVELIVVFATLTGFIIVTDMVGTPFQMLDPRKFDDDPDFSGRDLRELASGKHAIRRSLFVDAGMMIANAVMNVPPSVYYAENHILDNYRGRDWIKNGRPAFIYAGMLSVLAMVIVFVHFPMQQFQTLSSLVVAPVLFIVGVQVIAHAIRADNRPHEGSKPDSQGAAESAARRDELEFLPTALIIILTPVGGVGLEWSLPLGIACHLLRSLVLGRPMKPTERGIGVGAMGALILMLVARFVPA